MEGESIAEVRGIAKEQNLDAYIAPVVAEKLHEFPDGKGYEKKASDMKMLTGIERKITKGEQLSKEDLVFLYEINGTIEGFGYQRDPRIQEVRSQRDSEADMLIVLECSKEQIAHSPNEVNERTRAYVGELQPGVFSLIQRLNIEYIYTSFPEGKIRRDNVEIGGKSGRELIKELERHGIIILDYARDMLQSKDFAVQKNPEEITLIRLRVKDLGLEYPTTDQLYDRAKELGLELCPPDAAPNYRLKYKNQPLNEWFRFGMTQIADRDGGPNVFGLGHDGGGLWLSSDWAGPDSKWNPGDEFMFCLRKLKT